MKKKELIKKKVFSGDSNEFINRYILEVIHSLLSLDKDAIKTVIDVLSTAYKNDKKIFILGNGGSASTASHMACDLGKGTILQIADNKEKRIKVISLTENIALMTALANDISFDDIFIQQLKNLVEKDDVVLAISGSGNSRNVVKAIEYATLRGAITIGFLGFKNGGELADLVDHSILIDSNQYGPIEDIQLVLNHMITSWIAKIKNASDNIENIQIENKAVPFR